MRSASLSPSSKAISYVPTKLRALEFRVWRRLQALKDLPSRLLVACSGGVDSIVLVECLHRIAPRLGVELHVATVHHGRSKNPVVLEARDRAFEIVRSAAVARGLRFHGHRRDVRQEELRSEKDLREYRHRILQDLAEQHHCGAIVFAHHADDLFETRLIRLLRGTGPQGLAAMKLATNGLLRPFLEESRAVIQKYAVNAELA